MGRRVWTKEETKLLTWCYPDTPTAELADLLDMNLNQVYHRAKRLGLEKSAEYLASPAGGRLLQGVEFGKAHRFPKGHVPANKGVRRPGYAPGRMADTQFKPGRRPRMPIGARRVDQDGYTLRRIADTGYGGTDWRFEHVCRWVEANGAVPKGHAVAFKDRDRRNLALDNLELVSRAEMMRRNTIHNLPLELVEVIRLNGKIKQVMRRREREEQNIRSEESPVRDARAAEG